VAALTARANPARSWLLMLLFAAAVCRAAPSEYEVKAVFLFNFAQFVEWPEHTFAGPDTPFVIGVLGKDPFGSKLDAVLHGETAAGRPMVAARYRNVGEIHSCNILFIARSESADLPQILAALRGRSILTVSDDDAAGQSGVMIRLVTRDNRIRLQIDLGAAKAGNLTISSKLLRPAEIVGAAGS
jgi:hypothetical protein